MNHSNWSESVWHRINSLNQSEQLQNQPNPLLHVIIIISKSLNPNESKHQQTSIGQQLKWALHLLLLNLLSWNTVSEVYSGRKDDGWCFYRRPVALMSLFFPLQQETALSAAPFPLPLFTYAFLDILIGSSL